MVEGFLTSPIDVASFLDPSVTFSSFTTNGQNWLQLAEATALHVHVLLFTGGPALRLYKIHGLHNNKKTDSIQPHEEASNKMREKTQNKYASEDWEN